MEFWLGMLWYAQNEYSKESWLAGSSIIFFFQAGKQKTDFIAN